LSDKNTIVIFKSGIKVKHRYIRSVLYAPCIFLIKLDILKLVM